MQRSQQYQRYCPGEEQIKISDAICVGRRRGSFPKCRGCQFNDDEHEAVELPAAAPPPRTVTRPEAPRPIPTSVLLEKDDQLRINELFKAYDIRGKCPDPLSRTVAWRIGQGVAQVLRAELRGYDKSRADKFAVIVGRDMRRHSPEIAAGLIEGIRAAGSPVIDIGVVDTPQVYYAVNRFTCCGGVMVTASHNPAEYNGFKICGQKAKPMGLDTGLAKILKIASNTMRQANKPTELEEVEQVDLTAEYREFVREFLQPPPARITEDRPLHVVVDASNGMAGRWFPILFGDVEWLKVTPLNFDHNGKFVHDPDPLVPANLRQLCDRVKRAGADFGVCFDGDADRIICVDETGTPVRADLMTALLAKQYLRKWPGSTIVYDVRCSQVVREEIESAGGIARRERCGHVFLKKAMAESKAVFGGELSGHYYFRQNFHSDSAFIAFAAIVNMYVGAECAFSEMITPLQRYAHSGERNFRNDHQHATTMRLSRKYGDGDVDDLDGITVRYPHWWFNVRPSNTEPLLRLNLEAKNRNILQHKLDELYAMLGTPVDD